MNDVPSESCYQYTPNRENAFYIWSRIQEVQKKDGFVPRRKISEIIEECEEIYEWLTKGDVDG